MSAVTEIVTTDQIHDLWGCGYTILPRARHPDPFFVPPEIIPQGRSYQWWHLVHDKFHFNRDGHDSGWATVPASRHDGYFMPFGISGSIEVNGLGLFEKSKVEVDQERGAQIAAAHKQVSDWVDKTGGMFSGEVKFGDISTTVGDEVLAETLRTGPDVYAVSKTKTVETTVKIPKDMVPHMAAIFTERDRLKEEWVRPDRSIAPGTVADQFYAAIHADKSAPWWPTLHAILLPIAIENVRKSLQQETQS